MSHRVVIVGAGYAGVEAALHLNRKSRKGEVEVVLIDRNPYHTLLTEIHEVAGNRVSEDSTRVLLKDIFRDTRVQLVQDEIHCYDFEGRSVSSDTRQYPYDSLILAIGSMPNFYGIAGLKEHAFTLWSLKDAIRIREHIKECFLKAVQETDELARARLLTFVVGGAGFTGVEMVGELAYWTKTLAKEHGIPHSEVRLVIVDMLDRVLPVLDKKGSRNAHRRLEKMGIEIMLNTGISCVCEDHIDVTGDRIPTNTLIWAAGVRAARDTDKLGLDTGAGRRLLVDAYCRTAKDDVYAIGDVGGLAPEGGKPFPAMVETALQTGGGVADNILRSLRGKEPKKITVKLHGIMVCIGNYHGVSDIMGLRLPSWLSIVMKYLVNCHYLYGIRGFGMVWDYLHDEVLHRRQKETFLQKHYTKLQPAWWGTLLRVFLGGWWIWEAVQKITGGWFKEAKLASFLGMATDATGGASAGGAADAYTKTVDILNVNLAVVHGILGKEQLIGEATKAVLNTKMFFKVLLFHFGDFDLVSWFLKNVVLATDGLAMFFQILVVILELLVGLMLLGGCFTFVGAGISFLLMCMFITSTGIYEGSWWMVFAAIACMGGVGRAFGLDAYVLPWLDRVWENLRKNGSLRLLFFKKHAK